MLAMRLAMARTGFCHGARDGLQHIRRTSTGIGIPRAAIVVAKPIISRLNVAWILEQPFFGAVELTRGREGGYQVVVHSVLIGVDLFERISPGDGDISFGVRGFRDEAQGVEDVEGVLEAVDD